MTEMSMRLNIFQSKTLIVFCVLALSLTLFNLGMLLIRGNDLSGTIVLHFDQFKGIDVFGKPADLWSIWLVSLVIVVLNGFLAETLFSRERILSYFLLGSNVIISALFLVALSVIISFN